MADEVTPFPFATVDDLKARWPDMPPGSDAHAEVLLEDASQFILDVVPAAANASEATRRRIVCAVVRRAIEAESQPAGVDQYTATTGPFSTTYKPSSSGGGFYLTKQEKAALGSGEQKAFGVQIAGGPGACHRPWCSLMFGANYCSCGADLTGGEPLWEP